MSDTLIKAKAVSVKAPIVSFTPSIMDETTLREIFVARQPLVDRLVRDIRDATTSGARRHALLVGPRGIGKTHLVSMVYYTVKADTAVYDKLRVAWLREEEWSVFSYADLLVRIFRALANEYPEERTELTAFADRLMRLPIAEGEAMGEAKLLEWLDGRVLLLIAENVNDLFEGMGMAGQQALRAFLQNHSRALLLTTSPTLTPELSEHDAPFYGYFNITHLKELTREEARKLLLKIATVVEPDSELADYLQTDEADRRLRVIETLAGGHPRIWILFSSCMSRQLLDELVPLFVKMLDDLTPYYQERMRALPPQERRIVAYLCEQRGAVPVKEIAEDCRLKPNAAAALLGKLEEKGYVRKAPEPTAVSVGDRRIAYYEMREPLMRLCIEVKENRADPLRLIVEFLRCWFSAEAILERLRLLPPHAIVTRRYLEAALERSSEVWQAVYFLNQEGNRHIDAGEFYKALDSFDRAISLTPDDATIWNDRGTVLWCLENPKESLNSFDHAISLRPDYASAWNGRGVALSSLERWEESLESYDRAIALDPDYNLAYSNRAVLLSTLHRFNETWIALEKTLATSLQKNNRLQSVTTYVIHKMLLSSAQHEHWHEWAKALKVTFSERDRWLFLTYGLIQSIPKLLSKEMTDALAQEWLAAWENAAKDQPQMDVALRLLRAAVEWKQTRNRGVLLRLAPEERTVLEELLPRE